MSAPVYLIQGFFFQHREYLGTTIVPGDGAVAVVHEGMMRDMFAGIFWPKPDVLDYHYVGMMADPVGNSRIIDIELDDDWLSFNKWYDHAPAPITYQFRRDGDLWIGQFDGELTGAGGATCMLTPAAPQLMKAPSARYASSLDRH